ncbi:MAG: hypothetical protein ACE5HF_03120 [Gemmatimonadota bacterium]
MKLASPILIVLTAGLAAWALVTRRGAGKPRQTLKDADLDPSGWFI